MAMNWYAGRGKSRGDVYLVKRHNVRDWFARNGYLSLPAEEVQERIKKSHREVMFFDLTTHHRFITNADNFRNGEWVRGQIRVASELFNEYWESLAEAE